MIAPGDVSAIIVTRGDVVAPSESLIEYGFGEVIVRNNGTGGIEIHRDDAERPYLYGYGFGDSGAYGRYEAVAFARNHVVYFQDDDCIVPARDLDNLLSEYGAGILSALMPPDRPGYDDTVLIGWGAVCDRGLPDLAFAKWRSAGERTDTEEFRVVGADFVFPLLTPHVRVDGEHEDLPWAHAPNRTWSRAGYHASKAAFLAKARAVRDGRA